MNRFLFGVVATALVVCCASPAPAWSDQTFRVEHDIRYGTAAGQALLLDAYLPPSGPHPAVVVIHGGGWFRGDKSDWAPAGTRLAQAGFAAFVVNYRLAPRFPYPAAVRDVQTAVEWIRSHARQYGVEPGRIGALGGSAGGYLSAMLGTIGSGSRDTGSRVGAVVSWSGPMDLAPLEDNPEARLRLDLFLGTDPAQELLRNASPIEHVDRTDAPTLLVNSAEEIIPLPQATGMAARLREAGVQTTLEVLPGNLHAEQYAGQVWDESVAFLQRHLEGASNGGGPSAAWIAVGAALALVAGAGGWWGRRRMRLRRGTEPLEAQAPPSPADS